MWGYQPPRGPRAGDPPDGRAPGRHKRASRHRSAISQRDIVARCCFEPGQRARRAPWHGERFALQPRARGAGKAGGVRGGIVSPSYAVPNAPALRCYHGHRVSTYAMPSRLRFLSHNLSPKNLPDTSEHPSGFFSLTRARDRKIRWVSRNYRKYRNNVCTLRFLRRARARKRKNSAKYRTKFLRTCH